MNIAFIDGDLDGHIIDLPLATPPKMIFAIDGVYVLSGVLVYDGEKTFSYMHDPDVTREYDAQRRAMLN